jgi:hypothetical protein
VSRRSTQTVGAAVGVMACTLFVGCGGKGQPSTTSTIALSGWRAVDDAPGISQLAPDLGGLDVLARTDRRALVRDGEAIRASTFAFATAKETAEAQKRGAGDDYRGKLERAFRGDTVGRGPGVGLRLRVPRPTGSGSDTVELYLLIRGRTLTVAELVSARGFDPRLRSRVLSRLSR